MLSSPSNYHFFNEARFQVKMLSGVAIWTGYVANDKRQIQVENFSKQKMSRSKQIKTYRMHKKLHETADFCVEVMKVMKDKPS